VRGLGELLRGHESLADLDPPARRLSLREVPGLGADAPAVADHIDGLGPLTELIADPEITDVLVNGPHEVWVERTGRLERSSVRFRDAAHLEDLLHHVFARSGGRIDAARPVSDVRLPDGSRLHAVLPPIAQSGPVVSIRRFPQVALTLDDLVERGALTLRQAEALRTAIVQRRTMLISGATGSGKTTLAGALLKLVPATERIVSIEETPELRPGHPHHVTLLTRPANHEGAGAVGPSELLRAALRMRPDRIVVGEARGAEALVAIRAFATGHRGSLLTLHARNATHALTRLCHLALEAAGAPTQRAIAAEIDDAIDVVAHLERTPLGRRVVDVVERR
jgi:pilus assembly protein CpaF